MEGVEQLLSGWQLHPVADHFTIALLTIAILVDLVSGLQPERAWIRHMALSLMILGALAAGASYATGNMEAERVWKMMSAPAHDYFKGTDVRLFDGQLGHGALGYHLMLVFGVLAIWRILIAIFNFMAGSRGLYTLLAVIALILLLYQGHTGGELVYMYGVGTGPMAVGATPAPPQAAESATATPAAPPAPSVAPASATPLPTVFVPPATPYPSAVPSETAKPPRLATEMPTATVAPSASAMATPAAE